MTPGAIFYSISKDTSALRPLNTEGAPSPVAFDPRSRKGTGWCRDVDRTNPDGSDTGFIKIAMTAGFRALRTTLDAPLSAMTFAIFSLSFRPPRDLHQVKAR
jgi:hypothetical protein